MGRYEQAFEVYRGDLGNTLLFNLEANEEVLSLLRPFFPQDWTTLPKTVDERGGLNLANEAALVLNRVGERKESFAAYGAVLAAYLRLAAWPSVHSIMANISGTLRAQNRLAQEDRCLLSNLSLATLRDERVAIFRARLFRFWQLAAIGQWADAQAIWDLLDPMGRNWPRNVYRPGEAEYACSYFRF